MSQGEKKMGQEYRVQKVTTVVAGTDVRVREFVVAPGENIPWHRHSEITDWCYCLEGVVAAETRGRDGRAEASMLKLLPGQSCCIEPGIVHRLTNGSDRVCRYLLVQGGGKYDFNAVKDNGPIRP